MKVSAHRKRLFVKICLILMNSYAPLIGTVLENEKPKKLLKEALLKHGRR